ncbi:MAG: ATP-binding protein [Candidatus Micrarchaeota archaeon]
MYLLREEEQILFKYLQASEALALIGPRRAGKTTLAKRLLRDWKEAGGAGEYFDLEEINAPSSATDLHSEIQKLPKKSLVVLDEVQVLDKWEKVVRSEIENKKRKILVTGSSASLLSNEIASSLAGRAIPQTVFTLSYRDAKAWGIKSFDEYLMVGGYPECVLRPTEAPKLHKLYLELTVLRDVAARCGIREIKPLSDLAIILLSEPGKCISARKTTMKLGISQPTFRSFVQALGDAFLILSVPPYIRSPRERLVADAKHYAYDIGLQSSVSISTEQDYGRKLENVVANELVRKGYSLSYLSNKECECDFIAQKIGTGNLAIQVWSGDKTLPKRELDGLLLGMKIANAKGMVLSKTKLDLELPVGVTTQTIEEWLS